jgi:hypothetical protein
MIDNNLENCLLYLSLHNSTSEINKLFATHSTRVQTNISTNIHVHNNGVMI